MANTANITSSNPGNNGVFFRAPIGTPLPQDALVELDPKFEDQGIVGEDGVSQAVTRDTEDVKSYGGDTVYTLQTDYGNEITLTVLESIHVPTLRTVFGDSNVTEENGNIRVKHNKARLPRSSFVFEHLIDQGIKRSVLEIGQVTEVGDIVNVHSDVVKYELTIKTYPNNNGDHMLDYYALGNHESFALATALLPAGREGAEYSVQLQSAGGSTPYTYEAVGSLPVGLELSTAGVLSGTPRVAGEHSVTVKVTDNDGKASQKTLALVVNTSGTAAVSAPSSETENTEDSAASTESEGAETLSTD